jgi:hypothetical protein
MTQYEKWRANEIKRVGSAMQNEAEARAARHDALPKERICYDKYGEYAYVKADVAEVLRRRGDATRSRSYYTVTVDFDAEGNVIDV